ncbi:hypothetical protein [Aquimarina rhabdastrellae]
MKQIILNILLIVILFVGCQKNKSLEGNYSTCHKGKYIEIYLKKDAIRIASNDEWIRLSEWRKMEIKNNRIFFDTFGEWKKPTEAEVIYINSNEIELKFINNEGNLKLKLIDENIIIEESKEFWNKFDKRRVFRDCKKE